MKVNPFAQHLMPSLFNRPYNSMYSGGSLRVPSSGQWRTYGGYALAA